MYKCPFELAVERVDDPQIQDPLGAIIRITTANICGSDLHPYEGRAALHPGMVLGRENMGIVEEVGSAVAGSRSVTGVGAVQARLWQLPRLQRRVDVGVSAANPSVNPAPAFGYPMMCPYWGGQAELLRVLWADFNLLELPAGTETRPTSPCCPTFSRPAGYHGTELAKVAPGKTVAVFGAGPVGLMAALSANIRGASQTFVVDFVPNRLALAEQVGATASTLPTAMPCRRSWTPPTASASTAGRGRWATRHTTRRAGASRDGVGQCRQGGARHRQHRVVGVYEPQDSGAATEEAKQGRYGFDSGPRSPTGSASSPASAR